jgi:hypothetical protein
MNKRTIELAKQLLTSVPKAEMDDLIHLLSYYNRAPEGDRVKAMANGFERANEPDFERETRALMEKAAGSQDVYMTTSTPVCRCCGR